MIHRACYMLSGLFTGIGVFGLQAEGLTKAAPVLVIGIVLFFAARRLERHHYFGD